MQTGTRLSEKKGYIHGFVRQTTMYIVMAITLDQAKALQLKDTADNTNPDGSHTANVTVDNSCFLISRQRIISLRLMHTAWVFCMLENISRCAISII